MQRFIYFLIVGAILIGCDQDDSFRAVERNVVSEDEAIIPFEELLILLNLKTTDSTYLVVESVDSVTIYINNYYWTQTSSEPVDTTKIDKSIEGNRFHAEKKLNYLVIADESIEQPEFSTAGEIAQFLNSAFDLKPGEYVVLIESFQVTFNDGTVKKYYPFEYRTFKVEKNSRSAFVGEIELTVY